MEQVQMETDHKQVEAWVNVAQVHKEKVRDVVKVPEEVQVRVVKIEIETKEVKV